MSDTPKAAKSRGRVLLSLSKRLTKRLASPQNRRHSTEKSPEVFQSPSIVSISLDDCTPPQKKLNLDDSYDSPSNSPTTFLYSQTFCPDSPEVSWRWAKENEDLLKASNKKTSLDHDVSKKSTSEEFRRRTRSDASQAYFVSRDEKRRAKVAEIQKAEKIRSEILLQERLSKFEIQLKNTNSPESKEPIEIQKASNTESILTSDIISKEIPMHERDTIAWKTNDTIDFTDFTDFDNIFDESITLEMCDNPTASSVITKNVKPNKVVNKQVMKPIQILDKSTDSLVFNHKESIKIPGEPVDSIILKNNESFNDFFNDSDTDCLLLAATQQVESEITRTKNSTTNISLAAKTGTESKIPKVANSKTANISASKSIENNTATSSTNKEKRSSLYMKFLEDDEDDVFAALDDAWVLKATQSNKPRSPFQRYKSMPSGSTATSKSASTDMSIRNSGSKVTDCPSWSLKNGEHKMENCTTTATATSINMKRHVSSHTITSSTANLRGRQQHRRD